MSFPLGIKNHFAETEVYDSSVVHELQSQLSEIERENAQLRKLVTALREQRKETEVTTSRVPERDIRRELSRFGTDQAVVDFAQKHHLILPQGEFWYTMNHKGRTAWIDGLEQSVRCHGIPRITNGITCYIELGDGSLVLGHRDWLKYDRRKADLAKDKKEQTKEVDPLDDLILQLL